MGNTTKAKRRLRIRVIEVGRLLICEIFYAGTSTNLFIYLYWIDPQKYFYCIADSLGVEWIKLAANLTYYHKVAVIKREHPDLIIEQAMEFLHMWCNDNPKDSINRLREALQDIGRNDIVMMINKKVKSNN